MANKTGLNLASIQEFQISHVSDAKTGVQGYGHSNPNTTRIPLAREMEAQSQQSSAEIIQTQPTVTEKLSETLKVEGRS